MFLIQIGKRISGLFLKPRDVITSKNQIRCLYSGEELGIKKYEDSRKVVEHAIANHMFYKQQLRKQLMNSEYSLTHLEYALKNLLHIMNNTQTDILLLKDTLQTLLYKRSDFEGDKYRFDTIIMRAFHYLNMPDEAIQFFEDESVSQLFAQVTGYQILLDLLYENERYDDVLRIYEQLCSSGRLRQNKYIDVIILATYYRLNTPEALDSAYSLWSKISNKGNQIQFRKSRTFVAGLALKQNRPELALEILEGETTYVSMRHIKILAWARTGQFDKVFEMFRTLMKRHAEEKKYEPLSSVPILDDIERSIKQNGLQQDIDQFRRIRAEIESKQLVTNKTLDDFICAPFPILPQANIFHKRS